MTDAVEAPEVVPVAAIPTPAATPAPAKGKKKKGKK